MRAGKEISGREVTRTIANSLVTTSLVLVTAFAAVQAQAAEIDATSAVDAVTVYPDGASVTRVIALDLPSGDNTRGIVRGAIIGVAGALAGYHFAMLAPGGRR